MSRLAHMYVVDFGKASHA